MLNPKTLTTLVLFLKEMSMVYYVLNYKVQNKLYKTYSFSTGTPKSNKNIKPLMKSHLL